MPLPPLDPARRIICPPRILPRITDARRDLRIFFHPPLPIGVEVRAKPSRLIFSGRQSHRIRRCEQKNCRKQENDSHTSVRPPTQARDYSGLAPIFTWDISQDLTFSALVGAGERHSRGALRPCAGPDRL